MAEPVTARTQCGLATLGDELGDVLGDELGDALGDALGDKDGESEAMRVPQS